MVENTSLKWIVGIIGFVVIAVLLQYMRTPIKEGPPSIRITPSSNDFGDIPREIVKKTFTVENTGGSILEIISVSTSCGCTTAKITNDKIGVGAKTDLNVEMDPNVMGNITGKVKRIIYVQSNDPDQDEVEVFITANILG